MLCCDDGNVGLYTMVWYGLVSLQMSCFAHAGLCPVGVPSAQSLAKVSRMQRNRTRLYNCQTRLCSREVRWPVKEKAIGTSPPCGQSIFCQGREAMAKQIGDEQQQVFWSWSVPFRCFDYAMHVYM